jgi:hypothetical protein
MKNLRTGFFIISSFLLLTQVAYGQAPNLGRVASFTLFTTAGAFTNTGASLITGDIGTHVGALTGFPPGTVTGNIHVADSVTALAAANLGTAYAGLNALTCDSTIGATLGNGQILTPKVYCITTLGSINGNLTLDAMGNPNAVFVIKVNGALSAAVAARVLLVNLANFNNVYWQVNGAFMLGDSAIFKGTLLANGAISLLPHASVVGRLLTTAGAISIQNTSNLLPIKLLSFTAACSLKTITFNWATATEVNNSYFTVEASLDQNHWKPIGQVAGAGSSSIFKKYTYSYINTLATTTYYRLKQTDRDGNYSYSLIVAVNPCESNVLNVESYPNPSTGSIFLIYPNQDQAQLGSVALYDMLGNQVYFAHGFPSSINMAELPSGIYFLHVQNQLQRVVKKIVFKVI